MNPLQNMIAESENMINSLGNIAFNFEDAIQRKQQAVKAYGEAKEQYEAAEADFVFSMTFGNSQYAGCKNAEQREAAKDHLLIQARQTGQLANAWRFVQRMKNELDNAEVSYAQAETRFKAVRVAAELRAQMLRAATI